MKPGRRALLRLAAVGAASALPLTARAQTWLSRPIRFVVPFAPGGSSEIVARSTAVELSKLLGTSVYVENKPGGAGNVAMAEVAAATDQHTLVLGHIGTLAVNPVGSTPAEFAAFIARERERWKPVIARAKVKPD